MKNRLSSRRWFRGFVICIAVFTAHIVVQGNRVREAVVRDAIKGEHGGALFVSHLGHDPSSCFLNHFAGNPVLVRAASEGIEKNSLGGDPWGNYLVDKSTGVKGGLLQIGFTNWINPFQPKVDVNTSVSGRRVTVTLTASGWAVIDNQMTWIE